MPLWRGCRVVRSLRVGVGIVDGVLLSMVEDDDDEDDDDVEWE